MVAFSLDFRHYHTCVPLNYFSVTTSLLVGTYSGWYLPTYYYYALFVRTMVWSNTTDFDISGLRSSLSSGVSCTFVYRFRVMTTNSEFSFGNFSLKQGWADHQVCKICFYQRANNVRRLRENLLIAIGFFIHISCQKINIYLLLVVQF